MCLRSMSVHLKVSAKAKVSSPSASTGFELGHEIQFSAVGESKSYLINGWSSAKEWGTWSDGNVATIGLQLSRIPTHDLLLTIKGHSLVTPAHPKQEIKVIVNNVYLGTLEFSEQQRW